MQLLTRLSPALAVVLACLLAGCTLAAGGTSTTLRLYTSVTQDTVDAVLAVLAEQRPDLKVEVFRAPTGELDARIASELRSGGIQADVLWATDPLSTQRYAADGLLAPLTGADLAAVPAGFRSDTFVGTRLLNLVIVAGAAVEQPPTSWSSLADAAYAGGIALPDPGFAGSAFAALGYFATTDGYGLDYYRALEHNGADQLQAVGDVITAVAEGRYAAGISLDKPIRDAIAKGAPIRLVWPEPGAIALYSPAAVFATSPRQATAVELVEFLVSLDGQAAIAGTGWQPVRDDVAWPHGGPVVTPDWAQAFGRQAELLAGYRAIFGD